MLHLIQDQCRLIFLFVTAGLGQTVEGDSVACDERGHFIGLGTVTLTYSPPHYIDLPDRTLIIKHDPNSITGVCLRCNKVVTQPVQAKPDTTIIWRKDERN